MKIQIYGSYTCSHCMDITTGLMHMNIEHDFFDGELPQDENFLDAANVEKLPYVVILDDNGNVEWTKSGDVSITEIVREIKRPTGSCGES